MEFTIGEIIIVDYSSKLKWKKLNDIESRRNGRIAIVLDHVKKKELGDFNQYKDVIRYKILVGKEQIVVSNELLKKI